MHVVLMYGGRLGERYGNPEEVECG